MYSENFCKTAIQTNGHADIALLYSNYYENIFNIILKG